MPLLKLETTVILNDEKRKRLVANLPGIMGNSTGIAKRHYVREVTKEWMDKFWALKPSE